MHITVSVRKPAMYGSLRRQQNRRKLYSGEAGSDCLPLIFFGNREFGEFKGTSGEIKGERSIFSLITLIN